MNIYRNRLSLLGAAVGLSLSAGAFAAEGGSVALQVQDAQRETQIWTSYAFNPHLRALDISVQVNGNNAILTGTVDSGVEKDLAEQIALGVNGIKDVDNKIVVDPAYVPKARVVAAGERDFSTVVEDATITASVKSKLLWNDHTDGLEIDVDTRNGKVSLQGTADSAAAKDLAGRLARNTDNVIAVDNQLTIEQPRSASTTVAKAEDAVSDSWITAKVKSTLMYSRWVDGLDITVETKDGVVSLSGAVDSSAEKDLAVELSQNIRGVKQVNASALKVG